MTRSVPTPKRPSPEPDTPTPEQDPTTLRESTAPETYPIPAPEPKERA